MARKSERALGLLMQPWPRLLACMEIADRVHTAFARSTRLDISLAFPTRLLTVAPYLSSDLPCVPDASSLTITSPRPELYKTRRAPSAPAILFARARVTSMRLGLFQELATSGFTAGTNEGRHVMQSPSEPLPTPGTVHAGGRSVRGCGNIAPPLFESRGIGLHSGQVGPCLRFRF